MLSLAAGETDHNLPACSPATSAARSETSEATRAPLAHAIASVQQAASTVKACPAAPRLPVADRTVAKTPMSASHPILGMQP
eukprot:95557-Amphidinium_carterae.1